MIIWIKSLALFSRLFAEEVLAFRCFSYARSLEQDIDVLLAIL